MESFIVSVLVFVTLVGGLGYWQHRARRQIEQATEQVDQQICSAAEVAQRRHVHRFGRANTDLAETLKTTTLRTHRPRATAAHLKS